MIQKLQKDGKITASYIAHNIALNAAAPAREWETAIPIAFSSDWKGEYEHTDPTTQVRVLWSPNRLFVRFECSYRDLHFFEDSEVSGRRDQLWERDVAEVFLQPESSPATRYKEFEVAPNGMWVDFDIFPGGRADLKSGLRRSVAIDQESKIWTAELAIPIGCLTANFDPTALWRANLFRVEGRSEPRRYLAWQPTNTPQPNFHVPSAFGKLSFALPPSQ